MSTNEHILNVVARAETGKNPNRRLRRAGKIPAVIYSKGKESKNITLDAREWAAIAKEDFNLVILKEEKAETMAIVKEVQENFLKGFVTHIDFVEATKGQTLHASVMIHAKGDAIGASRGGTLSQELHEIEVECLPKDLPEHIDVDVKALDVDGTITVADLELPKGVKALSAADATVFHVVKNAAETPAAEGEEEAAE